MPVLFILAGPNGAGKTTFYSTAAAQGFIPAELPFINIDLILKDELGGYNTENYIRADHIYRKRVGDYISQGKDFMIESNLARQADYEWIENMRKAGFDIVLYFLCTQDLTINIDRVRQRVKEGGHDVPESIIDQCFRNGLLYLKSRLHLFTETYIIDNSFEEPIEMAVLIKGRVITKNTDCPKWVDDLLYIAERIEKKE
jgi:predicted ABC-type ATPase